MWRKSKYEEYWERQKAYLTRSIFEDVPLLSPVREEEESFDSSPTRTFPTSITRESLDRPYSPLSPLIIEREPNKHDEPEEFYRKLEKKVFKIYRKLFLEDRSDVSGLSYSSYLSEPDSKYCYLERRASFGEGYIDGDVNLQAADDYIAENSGTLYSGMERKKVSKDIINTPNDDVRPKEKTESEQNKNDQDTHSTEYKGKLIIEITPKCSTDNLEMDIVEEETQSTSSYLPKSTFDRSATYVIEENVMSSSSEITSEKNRQERNNSFEFLHRSITDEIRTYEEGNLCSGHAESYRYKGEPFGVNETSEKAETNSELSNLGYRQITFKADVHRDASEQDVQKPPSIIYEKVVQEENIADDDFDENNELLMRTTNFAELEENSVSGIHQNTTSEDNETQEIEEMRTPRICASMSTGSMEKEPRDDSQSNDDLMERPRSLEAEAEIDTSEDSESNVMDLKKSINYNVLRTSLFENITTNESLALITVTTRKLKSLLSPVYEEKESFDSSPTGKLIIEITPKCHADNLEMDIVEEETQSTSSYLPKSTSDGSATYVIEEHVMSSSSEITSEKSLQEGNYSFALLQRSISDEIRTYEEDNLCSGHAEAYRYKGEPFGINETSEKAETNSELSNLGYRQITFKADVHRDASEEDVQKPPSIIYEKVVQQENIADDNFVENNDNLAQLEENSVSDIHQNTTSDDNEPQEIEEMRTPRICASMSTGSMEKEPRDDSQSTDDLVERPRSLEAETEIDTSEDSETNIMDVKKSIDYSVLRTSLFEQVITNESLALKTVITSNRKSLLSPVHDEEESFYSSPAPAFSTSITSESFDCPYSPLSPLIIEKEPNRHDEPEEFYRKLEKKVLRMYRKLFLEDRSDVSGLSYSSYLSEPDSKYCYLERRASFGEGYIDGDVNLQAADGYIAENSGTLYSGMERKKVSKDIINTPNDDLRPKEKTEFEQNKNNQDTHSTEYKGKLIIEVTPKCSTDNLEMDIVEEETQSTSSYLPKSTSDRSATYVIEENVMSSSSEITSEKDRQERNNSFEFLHRSISDEMRTYEDANLCSRHAEAYRYKGEPFGVNETSEKAETNSELSNLGYRQITFKADVHRDVSEQDVQKPPSIIYEKVVQEENIANDDFVENNDNFAQLEENSVSDINQNTTSEDNEPQEIEEMRTPRVCPSMSTESMEKEPRDDSQSTNDLMHRPRSLEAETEIDTSEDSETNIRDLEKSIDYNVLQTSLFEEIIANENLDLKTVITGKRKSSHLPTSSKRTKYEDIRVQAKEDEDVNQRILCSVFAGSPRVFGLCSCRNNSCVPIEILTPRGAVTFGLHEINSPIIK